MKRSACRSLLAAAFLIAGTGAVTFGGPSGNVNGLQEQPLLDALAAIRTLEQQALALAGAEDQTTALSQSAANAVAGKINSALTALSDLKASLASGGPYQDSTFGDQASKELDKAFKSDGTVLNLILHNKPASKVVKALTDAESHKGRAQYYLMGMATTPKDAAALAANPVGPETVVHDADLKASKADVTVTPADRESHHGDFSHGHGEVRHPHHPKHGPELYVAGSPRAAAAPENSFYAFEGTDTTPGYIFKSFGRELFGPFEVKFQAGDFDLDYFGDTGSACIEFDVEGSSPLQFLAVCARRVNGGVQVFTQSHNGAVGNTFLNGALIVDVVVEYSGTQFTVSAKPQGFPDGFLQSAGTFNYTQGSTALVAGMGASGLTKGAPIGLDEIYITAK